jgi:hypothetical protein
MGFEVSGFILCMLYFTLWEEHRLRVFENRVLRRIFVPNREEVAGENFMMRNFIICTLHQILLGCSSQGG